MRFGNARINAERSRNRCALWAVRRELRAKGLEPQAITAIQFRRVGTSGSPVRAELRDAALKIQLVQGIHQTVEVVLGFGGVGLVRVAFGDADFQADRLTTGE